MEFVLNTASQISKKNIQSTIPPNAIIRALIVGIEDYNKKTAGGQLQKVDYARKDAEAFVEVLRNIYGSRLECETLFDSEATQSTIKYNLLGIIGSLNPDDVFIFYYAGHGFHGDGGNRITAFDTNPHHIDGTTLLLREVLLDPLQASSCRRSLAFVDACAANFRVPGRPRDVIAGFDSAELNQYLTASEYFALFLSCSPGEKSYPSDALQHGIWTYYLLRALRGEAKEALGPDRHLTDQGLKNYLRVAVKDHLTKEAHCGTQSPQAIITASGTFSIRQLSAARISIAHDADLTKIPLGKAAAHFEGSSSGLVRQLEGFSSRVHFPPKVHSPSAETFIQGLLEGDIEAEGQEAYDAIKRSFSLRSRDLNCEREGASFRILADGFEYIIFGRQHRLDTEKYEIVRTLQPIAPLEDGFLAKIDDALPHVFGRVVLTADKKWRSFEQLVDCLEDLKEAVGGEIVEDRARREVAYTMTDATRLEIFMDQREVHVLRPAISSATELASLVQKYSWNAVGADYILCAE